MCIGKRFVGIVGLVVLMMVSMGVENLYAQPNISAELRAIPETYSGPCPVTIRFEGKITVTNITRPPLEVQYRFIRSDDALAPMKTIKFDRDGSKPVRTTWRLGGPALPVYDGWQAIKVISPQDVESNRAIFKIECKGAPGEGAGLLGKKCCIAGTYDGTAVDDPRCPVGPRTVNFVMVINQAANCGSKIWGEKIDPTTGTITARFEGTVTPGPKRCCTIKGTIKGLPGTKDEKCKHTFNATLCRGKDGKWYTNNGVYHTPTPDCCSGKFEMKQR